MSATFENMPDRLRMMSAPAAYFFQDHASRRPPKAALGVSIVALILIVYWRSMYGDFIWDDDAHVTANPHIVGPLGLREIWTTGGGVYYPLVLTTFWMQYKLWGSNPLPYHLVNIGLHAVCALLLWRVLDRLKIRGAWLGAALWALHPVQVESVAWITELKNIQSGFFYLLSIWFFLRWLERHDAGGRAAGSYAVSLLFSALAILSKPSTVMLPVILGLCWWWKERKWRIENARWLVPFLLLSVMASIWTIWEQKYHSGALGPDWNQTWPEKIAIAGRIFWFYLEKLAWPDSLTFIYPRWITDTGKPLAYLHSLTAATLLVVLWLRRHSKASAAFFAFAYFSVSLFPVSNFFDVYFFRFSFVSDHFQYLPSMGPLALGGALLTTLARAFSKRQRLLGALVYIVPIAIFVTVSMQQSSIYRDNLTLWRDTLEKNPDAWIAHVNLGAELDDRGRSTEAIIEYRAALKLYPNDVESRNNLATHQAERGNVEDAVTQWKYVVTLNPRHALAHNNLGIALMQLGKHTEAFEHWEQALIIEPNMIGAHYNYGRALSNAGRSDEAIAHLSRAIELNPSLADAYEGLADVFKNRGEFASAIQNYRKALMLNRQSIAAKVDLAFLLATSPDAKDRQGKEAVMLAEQALYELGRLHPEVLDALAAAYAETGRFEEAVKVARQGLSMSPKENVLADGLRLRLGLYEEGLPYRHRE